jgi:hypothetical protein
MTVRVGRFQIIGLVGVALVAVAGLLSVVLPQLSPPISTPLAIAWSLFAVGGLMFWVGVLGGIVEVIRGTPRRPRITSSETLPPAK